MSMPSTFNYESTILLEADQKGFLFELDLDMYTSSRFYVGGMECDSTSGGFPENTTRKEGKTTIHYDAYENVYLFGSCFDIDLSSARQKCSKGSVRSFWWRVHGSQFAGMRPTWSSFCDGVVFRKASEVLHYEK